jgi:hypothetical protein
MTLIDADRLKQAILTIMPERSEVLLVIDEQPDIFALLKGQKAVKPRSKITSGEYPHVSNRCGNCNEILYKYYKFCPTCGTAVEWE